MDLTERLTQQGHRVTVVTPFPSRPAGKSYPGYRRRFFQKTSLTAASQIVRCFSFFSKSSTMFSRFLENLSFGMTSAAAVLVSAQPDVMYLNTWPLFATGCVSFVAWLRRIPYVNTVRDLYPESLAAQKRISASGPIFTALRWLDRLIAHRSRAVIVISQEFARVYRDQRGVRPDRLHVVPSWVHTPALSPASAVQAFRQRLRIPGGALVMLYGGNIGVAAGVETVIESMQELVSIRDLYLVIAGSGSNLPACRSLAERISPERIVFHSPWLIEDSDVALQSADILVLSTSGDQALASVPSKLVTYMLSSRPVVALVPPASDTAAVIEESGCGWVAGPGFQESFPLKVREVLALSPGERDGRGMAGRKYALAHFTSEVNVPIVAHLLTTAAGSADEIA